MNDANLNQDWELPKEFNLNRSRIMYIENKSEGLEGDARIGRVYFSKTGNTLYYKDSKFQSLKGSGFKANYYGRYKRRVLDIRTKKRSK